MSLRPRCRPKCRPTFRPRGKQSQYRMPSHPPVLRGIEHWVASSIDTNLPTHKYPLTEGFSQHDLRRGTLPVMLNLFQHPYVSRWNIVEIATSPEAPRNDGWTVFPPTRPDRFYWGTPPNSHQRGHPSGHPFTFNPPPVLIGCIGPTPKPPPRGHSKNG
jgi:hypothetical protein